MRVAVIGAGPIGLEAALRLLHDGHEPIVYEQGDVGDAVRRWGHVTLFTPWRSNTTARGREAIGAPDLDDPSLPTGVDLVERYLLPLSRRLDVRTRHHVRGIARPEVRKGQAIGRVQRAVSGFRLHVEGPHGAHLDAADAVLDCTGNFGDPSPAGQGGIEVPGEAALRARGLLRYGPVPVRDLAGCRVALVGDGASAATVLAGLLDVGATIAWFATSKDGPAFASPEDDPLPARRKLWERARAAREDPAVTLYAGRSIVAFHPGEPLLAILDDQDRVWADAVVACTGFRPDLSLHRELQVHTCYASEGPMKLAAALLAHQGAAGDCLDTQASGADLLRNPEPRFFVLGAKSYGRRSDFVLQTGHRQVDEVASLLV